MTRTASTPRGLRRTARLTALACTLPVLVTTAVTATVTATSVALAGPASAEEAYVLPASGLSLTGHGYGHGRGMSQYGAQGAALQGVGYRDILARYYPGTAVGALPGPPTVRVLISEDTDDDLTVRADPGLALVDADGTRWLLPAGPIAWRVRADAAGVQRVEQLTAVWGPWTSPTGRATFSELRFEGPVRIRVDLPGGGGRAYRGTVTAARVAGAALDTVNTVGFEQYLWGVLPREVVPSWRPDALRAQAVAARTYSAWKRMATPTRTYDLCSTTACQVYGGSASYNASGTVTEWEYPSTTEAVNSTAGEVRLSAGKPAFTEFSAASGGWTAKGGPSYLAAFEDPWDDFAGNPVHTWRATLTPAAVAQAYPTAGQVRRLRVTARDGRGEWGGRITTMVVEGVTASGAPTAVGTSGNDFRARLGLRSEWWVADSNPLQQHWLALGGAGSVLGAPVGAEYAVPGGRAQDHVGGRVYWSAATGAAALTGAVLARYSALGGPGGTLGLPTSDEVAAPRGTVTAFTGGRLYASATSGVQLVRGGVLQAYLAVGGPGGRLGLPVGEEEGHASGVRARFEAGSVYWSPATGAQVVEGAVLAAYVAAGEGAGPLGMPVAAETADGGGAFVTRFTGGRVYRSVAGAYAVAGAPLGAYLAAGGASGVLGAPVGPAQAARAATGPDGLRQGFAGGVVYAGPGGATALFGGVLDAYRVLGEARSPLGWPVAGESPVPGGVAARFTGGEIYWSARTGAHEVHGGIRERYQALAGPAGLLGLPTSDEQDAPGGRFSTFHGGHVYWTPATDAHEVHGGILQRYLQLGGAGSTLGAPTSDEYAVPGGRRSDFRGGSIVWRAATNETVVAGR